MKKWFVVLCCLFLALSTAWGATLLSEGFDGMEKDNLPDEWTFNKTADYFSSAPYIGEAKPALKLSTKTAELVTPAFAAGATNISFFSGSPATGTGIGNTFVISGLVGEEWIELGTKECTEAGAQTYTLAVENSAITQLKFAFTQGSGSGNSSLDDILVEGPDTFGVTLSILGVDGTTVSTATEVTLVATLQNGPDGATYTYAWSGAASGAADSVALGTLPAGDYTASCTVSVDGTDTSAEGSLSFTVKPLFAIASYASDDGSVTASADSAMEGETIELTVAAGEGKVLETMYLNGTAFTGTSFVMPAEDVAITADFIDYVGGDLTITFDETTSNNPKYADESFTSDGIEFAAVQCQGGDEGVSGKSIRLRHNSEENPAKFETASALEKPISRIKFAYKAYSASSTHLGKPWKLETSTDGANWTTIATVTTAEDWLTADTADLEEGIPANSTYFRIISGNTGSTTRNANFDEIEIWFGEATYHVELSGVENGARVPYDDVAPAVTLTAEAKDGGTEPFVYAWTVNGELVDGCTGETCEFSAIGEYEVSVVCTDATGGATEPASVSFSIARQFAVTCPDELEGGSIEVDAPWAFVGDSVTITATADAGYTLDGDLTATWAGGDLEIVGGVFTMPEGDVAVAGSFRAVSDTAELPFEHSGSWHGAALDGVTQKGLSSDYADGSAKFDSTGDWLQIKFGGEPGTLSCDITGKSLSEETVSTFTLLESADGETWTAVATYTSFENISNATEHASYDLSSESRFIKFEYTQKGAGNIALNNVVITKAGGEAAAVSFTGETTATVGGTITLSFALENYDGAFTWAMDPAEGAGEIDSATGVYTWIPNEAGSATITVNALDDTLELIATSGEILLTVEAAPGPGPEPILVEATLTGTVTFADGKAVFEVSLDNADAVLAAEDIWAADELTDASSWKQAEGAEVVPADGGYRVSVPESAGNFIAIGKPAFLATE